MKLDIDVDPRNAAALPFVLAWVVMLLLTGVSLWIAFLDLGIWASVVEFGIAAVQAAAVFILFMRLKGPASVKWIFAGSGFFWLLFLFGISFTDYATRRGWPWHG